MFERFTDRSRSVVVQAQEIARKHGHNYIGVEHLLTSLRQSEDSVAKKALENLGVSQERLHLHLELLPKGEGGAHLPFQPHAKRALELSLREALQLGHNYIGTEHLLLGLVRLDKPTINTMFSNAGITGDVVRREVINILGATPAPPEMDVNIPFPKDQVGLLKNQLASYSVLYGPLAPHHPFSILLKSLEKIT